MRLPGVVFLALGFLTGCAGTLRRGGEVLIGGRLPRIAVLPLERHVLPGKPVDPEVTVEEGAEAIVTAEIHGVLAEQSRFAVVPDLEVREALARTDRSRPLFDRARTLGQEVGADAVLCGEILRFRERVGTELGARKPASVGFRLYLVRSRDGKVVWQGSFQETQQELTSNLLRWWMFWRGGPKWLSAGELARIGVERLVEKMLDEVSAEELQEGGRVAEREAERSRHAPMAQVPPERVEPAA
ncbi:MAG: hypothetical protein KatS3mg076_0603 [Candidatus Binatia bacterium]|nr:MAG: hypothetical protein KatS3mg076_0603 [Candidatus Binatia bacterium]